MAGLLGLLLGATGPVVALLLLLWRTRARDLGFVVCLCAACGLGVGVSSLVWWLLNQLPVTSAATLRYLDGGFWAAAILAVTVLLPRAPATPKPFVSDDGPVATPKPFLGVGGALAVLLPIGGLAVAAFASLSFVKAHGEWDAWAIWNARARSLFVTLPTPGADAIVRPVLAHPDYPELLPGSVARAWTFAGIDDVSVPITLGAMFAVGLILVAAASVRRHSTPALGLLSAAFILASPALVAWAPAQGADVPLSFYILLTFVFAASAMTIKDSASLWTFAGLSASLAAWTKNEGIVFVMVAALVTAIWTWRAARGTRRWIPLAAFAAGATPALLVLIAFKFTVAPANDIVEALYLDRVLVMFTWERISSIAWAMSRELWYGRATTIGTLPLLVLFVAVNGAPGHRVPGVRLTLLALTLMLAAYALVYVLTPQPLQWHLDSSVDRVILQLMPSMVWAGMQLTGRSDEV